MDKFAVIDMGTNTFHLLIAKKEGKGISVLWKEKVSVKIGQGGINDGYITGPAYKRALETIDYFKGKIDKEKVKGIFATATSAVRNAKNGANLVKEIKERSAIEVKVISGEVEAELIYYGVKYAVDLGKDISLIMDIGGGSVEFIICNEDNIFWKASFEIGAQRLIDKFQKSDPIAPEDIQSVISFLDEKLQPLFEACKKFKPCFLVGSSGSFDTICDIDIQRKGLKFQMEDQKEYSLDFDSFEKIFQLLLSKNREERLLVPGMVEMRVDMIVIGGILIFFILSQIEIRDIKVSTYALKEGVLFKVLENGTF